jgi:hypothetical protein
MDDSGTEPRIPPGYFARGSQTISVIVHCIYAGVWGASVRLSVNLSTIHACASLSARLTACHPARGHAVQLW